MPGIGVDIVRTARFQEIITRHPQRLKRLCERILHPKEMEGVTPENAVQKLASAWAAKEALYKSLHMAEQKDCRFNEWRKEIVDGQYVLIHNKPRSDRSMLSISHDGEYTMAFVTRLECPSSAG